MVSTTQRASHRRGPLSRRSSLKALGLLGSAGLGCGRRDPEELSVWVAGDLHLGSTPLLASPFLKNLSGTGIVNLEGPIALGPGWQKGSKPQEVVLRNHPEAATWLRDHQIGTLSLLNNHQQDLGAQVAQQTKRSLSARSIQTLDPAHETLLPLGSGWQAGAAYLGIRSSQGVSPADREAIARAHAKGQRLLISVHIDGPPSFLPSPKLRAQVLDLANAGASLITLHGSHVIGPIERHGQCIIAWGLGNLSFACPCSTERDGLILQVQATRAQALKVQVIPIRVGNAKTPVAAHPEPDSIFELLAALESCPLQIQGTRALL